MALAILALACTGWAALSFFGARARNEAATATALAATAAEAATAAAEAATAAAEAATAAAEAAATQTAAALPTATPVPTETPPPPTAVPEPTPVPRSLRFIKVNENDDPSCISVGIRGVAAEGWTFSVDGLRLSGSFDGGGNARLCGLGPRQQVTFTVFNRRGQLVPGGRGVPSIGGAIMQATWR